MHFLQNEYTSLVVKSTFYDDTAKIFRQLENNLSTFSESALRIIRVAAELSTLSGPRSRNRWEKYNTRGRSAGFRLNRFRGWGPRNDFAGRSFNFRPSVNRSPDFDQHDQQQ